MNSQKNDLIKKYGSQHIIERLAPYITGPRKQRINSVLDARLESIQLAIESPYDINNALATVRTAEALGISTIHIINPEGEATYAKSITQGAIYWVDIVYHDSFDGFLKFARSHHFLLAGGSLSAEKPLSSVPLENPICIMIGNEQRGLSPAALAACEVHFKIPLYGMSESLNLSVSAGISLYDITSRKRRLLKQAGDLQKNTYDRQKAGYYLNSLELRTAIGLLKK